MKIHCATRLEPKEAEKLIKLATKRTISRSALMRQIIVRYLADNEKHLCLCPGGVGMCGFGNPKTGECFHQNRS